MSVLSRFVPHRYFVIIPDRRSVPMLSKDITVSVQALKVRDVKSGLIP